MRANKWLEMDACFGVTALAGVAGNSRAALPHHSATPFDANRFYPMGAFGLELSLAGTGKTLTSMC
jgi:hypothetical protein